MRAPRAIRETSKGGGICSLYRNRIVFPRLQLRKVDNCTDKNENREHMLNYAITFLVLLASSSVAHAQSKDTDPLAAERVALFRELRRCLDDLPTTVMTRVNSPCAERDVGLLTGLTRPRLVEALANPTWCKAADKLNYLPPSDCNKSDQWGYSFYRLPPSSLGGGPELLLEFDSAQRAKARWIRTQ